MKRIILKMGVLGVFCLVAGCSDDGSTSPLQPIADNDTEVSSSDKAVNSSSSSAKPSSETSTKSSDSKGDSPKDTVIHEKVILVDSAAIETSSYVSSGVFCWNAGCEKDFPESSSSAPKSSEDKIVFTESSASNDPPTIEGNTMKDNRDDKVYKIQSIAGKMWMAENLNYETSNSFCSLEGGEDHCAKYGRYYTYSAAMHACPSGWRLPTADEVTALDAAVEHEWWSIGGRFILADGALTEFGHDGAQGYIWIQESGNNNSFRVKNYDGDHEHVLQNGSGTERAYNVRCVQE